MPIYNTPVKYLREAIESILKQTYTDFEYLIINDSPENKILDKIINSYKDPRIFYFKNKNNLGLEASTNKLVSRSRGEYIAIFDHDDISLPDRLMKEVTFLDEHPEVGAVSAQFRVFGTEDWVSDNPTTSIDIKNRLQSVSCVSHTTLMFRKSIVVDNNIIYEKEFFPAASYRLITRLALVTNISNLPDILLEYRMDGNNTSITNADMRATSRAKIQKEYREELEMQSIKKDLGLDTIRPLKERALTKDNHYYKASRQGKSFFIKSDQHSLESEFLHTKQLYDKSNDHFVEPIEFNNGRINYLVMGWVDGVGLNRYIDKRHLSEQDKKNLIKDLYEIHRLLRESNIVHRDVIPRNFLVVSGRLKLIDLHYAVEYDNYQELDYVKNDIASVAQLGESFAYGAYKWDDAFSFVRIAEHILNGTDHGGYPLIRKMINRIGDRIIVPDGSIFKEAIFKRDKLINQQQSTIGILEDGIASRDVIIKEESQRIRHILESKSYVLGHKLGTPYRLLKKLLGKNIINRFRR